MIKLRKTIVDEKKQLIGFVVEGRDRDLDGFTDEMVLKPMPLRVFRERCFSNKQIRVTNRGIKEIGKFKINKLPMTVLVNNSLKDIGNKMELVEKIVSNDKLLGFRVLFGDGSKSNLTYSNVIQLSYWFRPKNFIVKTSASNKRFISGKPGVMKLEDLPEIVISKKDKDTKKAVGAIVGSGVVGNGAVAGCVGSGVVGNGAVAGSGVVGNGAVAGSVGSGVVDGSAGASDVDEKDGIDIRKVRVTGELDNEKDILDIFDTLVEFRGLIIKLPDEEYKATGTSSTKTAGDFVQLNVGEYAYPLIGFSENKLNVNGNFRKPGMVVVEFGPGNLVPVQVFTHNTKSIFYNGENYIKRLGVAIPKEHNDEFINRFESSVSVKQIEDTKLIQSVTALTGKTNMLFYEVNTDRLDLMRDNKVNQYYLSNKDIKLLVESMYIPKLINKYLSKTHGAIAELNREVNINHKELEGKMPIGLYAGMSQEYKDKLGEAGIDIYTGEFYKTEKKKKNKKGEDNTVYIDYMVDGFDISKLTCKKIKEAGIKGVGLPESVIKTIRELESINDKKKRLIKSYEVVDAMNDKINEIRKKLWLHKCAMFIEGNKSIIHPRDNKNWVHDTSRRADDKIYNCIEPGCEGLMLRVSNIDLV